MSNTQAQETSQQPKFSPYPLFLYALGSSVVLWLCLEDFLGVIFYPEGYLSVHVFPGYFCAQVTILGMIAGLVGRHWLFGTTLSLGLQTLMCTLAYALEIANLTEDDSFILSSIAMRQHSVLTVVLPAIPALVMRNLKSWRIALNPTLYKSQSILEVLMATTVIAMVIASEIQSHQPVLDFSIYVASSGVCLVALLLPVVRMSLNGSSWTPRPKLGVYAYAVVIGGAASVVLAFFFNPFAGLIFAFHYSVFAICVWTGICCLGASGLRFRSQQMDDEAHRLSRETSTESEGSANGSPDLAENPCSDDVCDEPQFSRASPPILGRWSLVMIAVLIAGFTLFKMWVTQRWSR